MTGKPLETSQLIKLNFFKVSYNVCGHMLISQNSEGAYHDPISFKVFSPYVHIVFLKNTVSYTLMKADSRSGKRV